MVPPDDFGLGPVETLAHVGDASRPPGYSSFWKAWREAVLAHTPRLARRPPEEADPSDPSASHTFVSARHFRIGGALVLPPDSAPARAGVVTVHGYGPVPSLADDAARWAPLAARGVAVLVIRVRGFPGSRLEDDDLCRRMAAAGNTAAGWITHGIESCFVPVPAPTGHGDPAPPASRPASDRETPPTPAGTAWVLSYAVADVVNACRSLRALLDSPEHRGPRRHAAPRATPIYLHGESLGAALAIIAASQLAEHEPIDRLAIGLPTLGDWPWRLAGDGARGGASGTGAELREFLRAHRIHEDRLVALLRLFDTVVHARRVRAPALCKLALRDDVVPAPAAAAVFNALGADPGRKRRFVTAFGHFDGGLADLRRHAAFDRLVLEFLDPARSPDEVLNERDNAMHERPTPAMPAPSLGAQPTHQSTASTDADDAPAGAGLEPGPSLFGSLDVAPALDDGDAALIDAYAAAGRTLDDLPYTAEFDRLHERVCARVPGRTKRDVFHRLHNLRKAAKLPRLGRAASRPPAIDPDEERWLAEAVAGAVGTLGQRDRLPYTPEFDDLVERFNARTGRSLGPHEVWRLVAKLAK